MRRGMSQFIRPGEEFDLEVKLLTANNDLDKEQYLFKESDLGTSNTPTFSIKDASMVTGFDPKVIKKMVPAPKAQNHSPRHLAYIEFNEPDLLWRYTPEYPADTTTNSDHVPDNTATGLPSWLYLLVLEDSEFTWKKPADNKALTQIHINNITFRRLFRVEDDNINGDNVERVMVEYSTQSHLWAAIQSYATTTTQLSSDLVDFLDKAEKNPSALVGRLVSPRKLNGRTNYHAFLIPHYTIGINAGLGVASADGPIILPVNDVTDKFYQRVLEGSNGSADFSMDIPVYHNWMFQTKEEDSFLTYAKLIRPLDPSQSLSGFSTSIGNIGYGLEDNLATSETVMLEGLYGTPSIDDDATVFVSSQFTNLELMDGIRKLVNLGLTAPSTSTADPDPDPAVVPPAYGFHQRAFTYLDPKTDLTLENDDWDPWPYELNLDPRYRAIAGLGAQVIRENQDYFVEQSLDQYYAFNEVNQAIGNLQNSNGTNTMALQGLLTSANADYRVQFYGPVADKVMVGSGEQRSTLEHAIHTSALGQAYLTPHLRNLLSPRSNLLRKFTGKIQNDQEIGPSIQNLGLTQRKELDYGTLINSSINMVTWKNLLLSIEAFPLEGDPEDEIVNLQELNFYSPGFTTVPEEISLTFYENLKAEVLSNVPEALSADATILLESWPDIDFATLGADIKADQNADAQTDRSLALLGTIEDAANPGQPIPIPLEPIEATPSFRVPMSKYLARDYPELLAPQVERLPDNSIALVAVNDKFVEAYMVGLNNELASEFRWRNLPVNRHGTYFELFWDKSQDVGNNPTAVDIDQIDLWDPAKKLGQNVLDSTASNSITFLIKAELFRKYPDAVVFLQKAHAVSNPNQLPVNVGSNPNVVNRSEVLFPTRQTRSKNNIVSITFRINLEDALDNEGWFICMQERPTELTLGFEQESSSATDWANLLPISNDPVTGLPTTESTIRILTSPTIDNSPAFATAAMLAPYRIYIHLSNFLPNA